jgi:propionyl-CoA synthetase
MLYRLLHLSNRLPKTRSGKILRGTMQKIADAQSFKTPATIDDPAILDEIAADLKTAGYANGVTERVG